MAQERGGGKQLSDSPFRRFSTRVLPASQRLDYWRNLHPFIDIDAGDRSRRSDFRAEVLLHIAENGMTFGFTSGDDAVSRFARSGDDYVLVSLGLSGAARIRTDEDELRTATPSSGLVVMDGTRPMTVMTKGYSHIYLTLPKARLAGVFAENPGLLRGGFCDLLHLGLSGLLMSHLMWLANHGERLDTHATAVAMKAAADLAVGMLAGAHVDGRRLDERHDEALYTAACRYIRAHLADHHLTAASIAHALGCSRTHLYRIFASYEQGIGEVVRAERLERASALLASQAPMSVEQVAMACGFASPSAFTRSFREATGLTPSAYREQSREI